MLRHVRPEEALHAVHLVLAEERVERLVEGHAGHAAGVVAKEQQRLAAAVCNREKGFFSSISSLGWPPTLFGLRSL